MKGYDLSKLVGRELIKRDVITEGILGRKIKPVKWLVIKAYPHMVVAIREGDNGFIEQAGFSVGDLVIMGVLRNNTRLNYWKEARL